MKHGKVRIVFNAPVILWFSIICLIALIAAIITGGRSSQMVFSVYRSSLADPLTYVRLVGHVFGHADWEHILGNITLILVVGPLLEEKYGSMNLLFVMLATALVTGLVHMIFFPHVQLLGASGIVFAFILLSSITSIREGSIPLTFILVAIIYIGGELYASIFVRDNVSNLTHILGGIVGAGLGFIMNKNNMSRY